MRMLGTPPTRSPHRAPHCAQTKPTSGPPIGVEPCQASAHSDITRPRMAGAVLSWSEVLASELKLTLP